MNLSKGLFTSNKDNWETPNDLFDKLNEEFNFDIDLCATEINTKCNRFIGEKDCAYSNNYSVPYFKCGYMNPPYGRNIGKFVRKAYLAALDEKTVVCLLPARTDTKWWHNYCMRRNVEIRFLKGRVKFINPNKRDEKPQSAPFPSAIVIFRPMGYKKTV